MDKFQLNSEYKNMEWVKLFLSKLNLSITIFVTLIVSATMLVLSDDQAKFFGVDQLIYEYRQYIGLGFFISSSVEMYFLFAYICKRIKFFVNSPRRVGRKYFETSISKCELEFLITQFYDFENKEFISSSTASLTEGRIVPLIAACIIYKASELGYLDEFAYNLNPWAMKYLSECLKKGTLVINKDGSWNYRQMKGIVHIEDKSYSLCY